MTNPVPPSASESHEATITRIIEDLKRFDGIGSDDVKILLAQYDALKEQVARLQKDATRLNWTVRRSAMLFRRETPEPMVMVAFYPLAQDGFLAAEYEGRDIPVSTPTARLSAFSGDVNAAFRYLIDAAMSSGASATEGSQP